MIGDSPSGMTLTGGDNVVQSYCIICHLRFALAEKRVPTPLGEVHEDCLKKLVFRKDNK